MIIYYYNQNTSQDQFKHLNDWIIVILMICECRPFVSSSGTTPGIVVSLANVHYFSTIEKKKTVTNTLSKSMRGISKQSCRRVITEKIKNQKLSQ